MADYNQDEANGRHRERRERLQRIRDELSDIVNDYYENFPESQSQERDLEYQIEERLRRVHTEMDRFVSDFRRYPNS